jgi:hypothetical protein
MQTTRRRRHPRNPATEILEERWFLTAATPATHRAQPTVAQPTTALHATSKASPATETADAEDATATTAPPAAPSIPAQPTTDATLPPPTIAPPDNSPRPQDAKTVLTDTAITPAIAQTAQRPTDAPPAPFIAAIFNTRHPITPDAAALTAINITTAPTPTRAVTTLAVQSPRIIKSTADALLSLTRPDLLATFADAITNFAHESATTVADTLLAAPETHYYKWQVTAAVLGVDALLVGHWYAARRRQRAAAATAAHSNPFSTQTL